MRLDLRKNTIIDKRTNKCIDFWSRRNDFCIRRLINSNLAGVYYLGTGTSFDIKSKFPDSYQNFTVDNFIAGGLSGNVVAAKSYTDGISGVPVARANGFSISKSYNAQTGVLEISGNTQQIRQGYDKAVNITYGNAAQTIQTSCWLVIGEIQQP